MSSAQKRKCFLDPCHSKSVNVSNLQLSRMKLKMKLELRALKKITEEVVHEGDSYAVVVPANVYENPLDTVPTQVHEGISGCYGSATEEQLKMFFGENVQHQKITPNVKDNSISTFVEEKTMAEPMEETDAPTSPEHSLNNHPVYPIDDIELQNAIWNITPDLNLENPTAPSDQISFDDFLMDHASDGNSGVLFDLS